MKADVSSYVMSRHFSFIEFRKTRHQIREVRRYIYMPCSPAGNIAYDQIECDSVVRHVNTRSEPEQRTHTADDCLITRLLTSTQFQHYVVRNQHGVHSKAVVVDC